MLFAIVVAGGSGLRFSSEYPPKQYIKIRNEHIIYITVKRLLEFHAIQKIVVCARKEDLDLCEKIFEKEIELKKVFLIIGGKNRIDSSVNGLNFIQNNFHNQCDIVMIHDAVRPLINTKLLEALVEKINSNLGYDGVLPVLNINEALKKIEDNNVMSVNRNLYYVAQTPQIFRFEKITECVSKNYDANHNNQEFHDEVDFMQQSGYKIDYVKGCKYNIKITTPEDFTLANYLLTTTINLC